MSVLPMTKQRMRWTLGMVIGDAGDDEGRDDDGEDGGGGDDDDHNRHRHHKIISIIFIRSWSRCRHKMHR